MHRVASRQRLFSWDHFDAQAPSDHSKGNIESPNYQNIHSTSPSLDDDLSDYRTCPSMSRPTSMVFQTSHSFGYGNDQFDSPVRTQNKDNGNDFVFIVSDDEGNDHGEDELDDLEDLDGDVVQDILSMKLALTAKKVISFSTINQDVQFAIMSFLDLNALKALTLTCRHFNTMLGGKHAEQLNGRSFVSSHSDIHLSSRNAIWWNLIKQTWPSLQLGSDESSLSQQKVNFVIQDSQ